MTIRNPLPTVTEFMVETFTGRFVDTKWPRADQIALEDIAHALAQTCRYGGHCKHFYSVAEHAVYVSRRLEQKGYSRDVQLAGLHHDDAEAYLGDIPRPLKTHLGERYRSLSDRMDRAIVAGLHLPFFTDYLHREEVKDADNWALFVEARSLLPSKGLNWEGSFEDWDIASRTEAEAQDDPPYWRGGQDSQTAEAAFLSRHFDLI